ncbi:MAG: 4-(cytidine 5'-diphospho)-2-C-methyl-D-erythritol kinase [Verrucomicrobiota bacterium]|jgi:4-diphosphocytidyl-2-C-methyl-D-erythritol kinase
MPLVKHSSCKVNLLLNILGKRPDGFHELETVIHPVHLHDSLTFERQGANIRLVCNDPLLPINGKNLVFAAAERFLKAAGISEGVRIHLEKRIPIAAGLGGGSGNAATTLLALNELFGHPLDADVLGKLAAALGSDVPFFLQSRPALATGRGEIIAPLDFFPALAGCWLVLVHPGFGVSTAWAYQQLARHPECLHGKPGRAQHLISLLQTADLPAAGREFYNSFQAPVLGKYPLLALFQEFFREHGAGTALMSGSGSSTFALADSSDTAGSLLEKFQARFGPQFWSALVKLGAGEGPGAPAGRAGADFGLQSQAGELI